MRDRGYGTATRLHPPVLGLAARDGIVGDGPCWPVPRRREALPAADAVLQEVLLHGGGAGVGQSLVDFAWPTLSVCPLDGDPAAGYRLTNSTAFCRSGRSAVDRGFVGVKVDAEHQPCRRRRGAGAAGGGGAVTVTVATSLATPPAPVAVRR